MMESTAVLPAREGTREVAGDTLTGGARKQIRGSSLLLAGRLLSVGAKLVAQILVVRYLSTAEYGAWAYALAAVAFLGAFAHLSLDRAVPRFAAIYHQRGEHDRFFGIIALVTGAVLLTSLAFITALYVFPEWFVRLTAGEATTLALLFVVIFLVPLEALDALLIAIFATFSRPRAIFLRRYLLTPAVQVSVVLLLIALKADVLFLAYGYVAGALLGVLVSTWLLFRILAQQGLLRQFSFRRMRLPTRELFTFSAGLMTSDWLSALTHASGAFALGYLYGPEDVGFFRVVLPIAVLNQLVIQSFHMLYVPNAARLFAAGDHAGVNDLHWRTSVWIAVLSFPLFAVTFAAATPLTVLFFGERYQASGLILSILVLGQYAQAGMGFNGSTISVLGKANYLVVISLLTAIVNLVLTVLLVKPLGAVGAAVAMSATMVVHNILKQIGLHAAGGFGLFDRRYIGPYAVVAGGVGSLVLLRVSGISHPFALAAAAVLVSFVVLLFTRKTLHIGDVFPEIARIPLLREILT